MSIEWYIIDALSGIQFLFNRQENIRYSILRRPIQIYAAQINIAQLYLEYFWRLSKL